MIEELSKLASNGLTAFGNIWRGTRFHPDENIRYMQDRRHVLIRRAQGQEYFENIAALVGIIANDALLSVHISNCDNIPELQGQILIASK